MLIVFEGIDRSGKTTQCKRLFESLREKGYNVASVRYPDRSSPVTGGLINDYLSKKVEIPLSAASFLLLANSWENRDKLVAELEQGKIVIMDRYLWSNIAYSVARGMNEQVFTKLNEGLPEPDLYVFIDVDAKVAASRSDFGMEIYDNFEFQSQVMNTMRKLHASNSSTPGKVIRIDGGQVLDTVAHQILESILPRLPQLC